VTIRTAILASTALFLGGACAGDGPDAPIPSDPGDDTPSSPTDFGPSGDGAECHVDALLQPHSYGAKVKTLLTGLPLSDDELAELDADPEALGALVDGWIAQPEADAMLGRFFMNAFQQTALDAESFFYLLGRAVNNTGSYNNPKTNTAHEMINQGFSESMARTAVELVRQGRPFTDVLTTDSYMLTTAQLAMLAYLDDEVVDDDSRRMEARTTLGDFPVIRLLRDQADMPPAAQVLDPDSPNFLTFWMREFDAVDPVACDVEEVQEIDTSQYTSGEWRIAANQITPNHYVFMAMLGRFESVSRHQVNGCNTGAFNGTPLFDRADFDDWHMVKISQPTGVQTATKFYDLPALRAATEVRLHMPRRGFYSTPGFHSTWQNNEDNSSRVTTNQMLIVALGKTFEGVAVSDFTPQSLDAEHAGPDTECYSCHQTLDPMRDFVRGSFTNFYGQQLDPERMALEADFVFNGVEDHGSGVGDFAAMLAAHPAFASGWAQKLCYYANASACPEGAELDRVSAAFAESGFDFRVLVRELFSSPLVTGSACIEGVDAGTAAIIARRSQFCGQLSHRMGIEDLCSLGTLSKEADDLQKAMSAAVASVPDDGFSRAEVAPVTIAETSLFTRANDEAACVTAAQEGAFLAAYDGMAVEDALDAMVSGVMGLAAGDPRRDEARAILGEHVADVLTEGETEEVALESAFVLACMSPGSAGVGF
jgi:hypothetical protein